MKKGKTDYLSWFEKAEEDGRTVSFMLKESGGSASTGCFLSQQVAEKYLKGLLVFCGKSFPKIHDLLILETLLLKLAPEIKNLHTDLQILNRFYLETRYPVDYPEFTWNEFEQAFKAATRVKKLVLSMIR